MFVAFNVVFNERFTKKMNCGPTFLNWIQSIWGEKQAGVLINGSLMEKK